MQKISEIISKPVYSLFEGTLAGTIKSFFFNPKSKKITGFCVFSDETDFEYFLPSNKIFSLGESSITIKNLDEISIMQESAIENNKIIYNTALTIDGNCLGKITDCFFDESFFIVAFETSCGVVVPSEKLFNVGNDAVVFDLESASSVAKFKPKTQKIIVQNLPEIKVSILNENPLPIISNNFSQQNFSKERKIQGNLDNLDKKTIEIAFPQKISSSKSILGKRANKTILGLNGEIIVKDMQVITEKIIEKAKKHSKFFELANSIEESC